MGAREGMTRSTFHRLPLGHCSRCLAILAFLMAPAISALAQDSPPAAPAAPTQAPAPHANEKPPATPQDSSKPSDDAKSEVSSHDTAATFKLRVNLVQVRVVVRDSGGNLVPGLHKEDFQVFDQGRLQTISTFGIETPETRRQKAEAAAKTQSIDAPVGDAPASGFTLPERFVALVFDDIHLSMEDATFSRVAAGKFLDSITPSDRVGIYTASGQITQEFTNDQDALRRTLLGIVPRPRIGHSDMNDCPDVTHYMADLIENKHDPTARSVVITETLECAFGGDPTQMTLAASQAEAAVMRALNVGDTENDYTYRHLEDVLRRMSSMPGERVMLLVSPGFLLTAWLADEIGIIDRANHASIVINTLDARGLYTPDIMGDISRPNPDTFRTGGYKATYRVQAQTAQEEVLRDFAAGTGGTFYHNSNDLQGQLKLAGATPEVTYVLGFSPQNQKMDGKYHSIAVKMTAKQKYSLQARHGYFAPKKVDDPQEQAKQEIQEAVFSQEEIHELPLDLQTQYFKTETTGARLSVVSRLDLRNMHFRKADGRNLDNLTIATAVFDENGNYVTGGEKFLQMRLLDTTYTRLSRTGLTVKSSFEVKPGRYLVRQVVRDSEGAQMAARNGAVEIPY
jgi:VWFA-related protein